MPYADKVEVWNAAILRIGAYRISSISDERAECVVLGGVYTGIVDDWFTKHGWSFNERFTNITASGESGTTPKYAYALPSDITTFRYAEVDGCRVEGHQVVADKLLHDSSTTLTVHYAIHAPENEWPGDFAEGIVQLLHAALLRSLVTDERAAAEREAKGEEKLKNAMVRDQMQSSGRRRMTAPDPPLTKAWRGGTRKGVRWPVETS